RQWPPASIPMSRWSMTSCWATITLRSSVSIRRRASPRRRTVSFSSGGIGGGWGWLIGSICQQVEDDVDAHGIGALLRKLLEIPGVDALLLPTVAEVGVAAY